MKTSRPTGMHPLKTAKSAAGIAYRKGYSLGERLGYHEGWNRANDGHGYWRFEDDDSRMSAWERICYRTMKAT